MFPFLLQKSKEVLEEKQSSGGPKMTNLGFSLFEKKD